jgi:hypothetical protein
MDKRIQVGDCFSVPNKGFHQTIPVLFITPYAECSTSKDDHESDTDYGWAGLSALASTTHSPAAEQTTQGVFMVPPSSLVTLLVVGYQPNVETGVKVTVTKRTDKRPVETFSCYIDRSSLIGLLFS